MARPTFEGMASVSPRSGLGPASVRVHRERSSLGDWILALLEPADPAWAAEGIWYFEGRLRMPRERHLPSARLDLIVHLGAPFRDDLGETFPGRCVSGLRTRPDVIEAPSGPTAVLGIRLHPLGAYGILGAAAGELSGGTEDLDLVLGDAARELAERCEEISDARDRVLAAARWLRARLAMGPTPDPAVAWMVRALEAQSGRDRIKDLVAKTGWSTTRLTDVFRREVGVTPKAYARIVRFRGALDRMSRGEEDLSRLALSAGYYDQPHFNGEFRAFAEMTPSEYLASTRFPGARSLAEEAPKG